MADLFFILNDFGIASYTDVNTPYVIIDDVNGVIESLEKASKDLFEWLEHTFSKSNADKCQLWQMANVVSSSGTVSLRVSKYDIKISECEKLLSAKFENKLIIFEKYITDISITGYLHLQSAIFLHKKQAPLQSVT